MVELAQDGTGRSDTFHSVEDSSEAEIPLMQLTVSLPPEFANEGDVLLRVHSNALGEIDTAWVIRSSGYPEVDSLALDKFVGKHRFNIAGMDGEPVNALLKFRPASFFERFIQGFGTNPPDTTD